ncbi:hypothetical protein CUMW_199770 [Citrus unshiu]|nr:hypothetical protein CUMW_199770 [Citrus unshiu]
MALCLLQEICLADDVLVDEQDISAPVPPRTRLLRNTPDICSPCLVSSTYFSQTRPIVFRNLKTENILFNEENVAKLFDFSLSISIPEGETHVNTDRVIGTRGYSAPEYISTCFKNEKSHMGAIIRKFRDRNDKRRLMMRNGTSVLKELIASSNGKYNPCRIFAAKELEIAITTMTREKL